MFWLLGSLVGLPVRDECENQSDERNAATQDHEQGQQAFLVERGLEGIPGEIGKSVKLRRVERLHPDRVSSGTRERRERAPPASLWSVYVYELGLRLNETTSPF